MKEKFKGFIKNYSVAIFSCMMMALLLGVWFTFATPTKTIIGDDVHVIGDLTVEGELGLPGIIRQVQFVNATERNTFSSTSWTQIPGTAVTITTSGGKVLLLGNVDGQATGEYSWAYFTIRRDGVNLSSRVDGLAISVSHSGWNYMHPMMWVDSPPAGTYTYDLAIRRGGSHNYEVGEHNPSVLIALEIRQ